MSDDPYVYPLSGVLRNRRHFRDPDKFDKFEQRSTSRRLLELYEHPVQGRFDATHLRAIHKHIFQDVYEWADQFRTTPLLKQEYAGGPVTRFSSAEEIETQLNVALSVLPRTDYFRHATPESFAVQAAELFAQINNIHPL